MSRTLIGILTGEPICTIYEITRVEVVNQEIIQTVVGQVSATNMDDLLARFGRKAREILGGEPLLKRSSCLFPYYSAEAGEVCLILS